MTPYQESLLAQCKKLNAHLEMITEGFLDGYANAYCNPVEEMIAAPINAIIKLKFQDPQAFAEFFELQPRYKKFIVAEAGYYGSYVKQLKMIQERIQSAVAPVFSMPAAASMESTKLVAQISNDARLSKSSCTIS